MSLTRLSRRLRAIERDAPAAKGITVLGLAESLWREDPDGYIRLAQCYPEVVHYPPRFASRSDYERACAAVFGATRNGSTAPCPL